MRNPYYGALLWVWIGLMNPHRLGWGFAYTTPFALMAVIVTVISMGSNPKLVRWPRSGPVTVLILLTAWMGLTSVFAVYPSESLDNYTNVLKVLVMAVVVGCVTRTKEQILGLVAVSALSIGFYGVKGGWFTLTTGGAFRVWGPPQTVIEDNNELAVALIVTIPLLYYLTLQVDRFMSLPVLNRLSARWVVRGLYVAMGLTAFAAIGSQSRGALLAMSAMFAVLWWKSKAKLQIGLLLLILAPALLMFMPDSWTSRMNTIQTYDQDMSALGRLNAWQMAINIANSRIFGAGYTNATALIYQMYAPNSDQVIVAHSIYFQVLGQHGWIGLLLFLSFWILTYRTAGRLVRAAKGRPEYLWVEQLGAVTMMSLIGFAVGGAFLNLAYWDMPYYFMVLVVAAERWLKEQPAEVPERHAIDPARAKPHQGGHRDPRSLHARTA